MAERGAGCAKPSTELSRGENFWRRNYVRILSANPRAKPSGLAADTVAIGSLVLVETSSVHSCCCFGGTAFPPKTARIQRSTSRGLEMAPPADCIQEVLASRMSRPTITITSGVHFQGDNQMPRN